MISYINSQNYINSVYKQIICNYMMCTDEILVEGFRINHLRNSFTEWGMDNKDYIPSFEVKVFNQMSFLNQGSTFSVAIKWEGMINKQENQYGFHVWQF